MEFVIKVWGRVKLFLLKWWVSKLFIVIMKLILKDCIREVVLLLWLIMIVWFSSFCNRFVGGIWKMFGDVGWISCVGSKLSLKGNLDVSWED